MRLQPYYRLRRVLAALSFFACFSSDAARADESFEFMYYAPKLQDYVPGYSVELMKSGGLIGYPRKLSTCTPSSSNASTCTTNMCRLSTQMQAWRACQEALAQEQRQSLPTQPSPGKGDPNARPATGGAATRPAAIDVSDRAKCFGYASDLLRQRILVLYSTHLSPDEIADALALIDDELNALQHSASRSYQVPCGMHISAADTFPRLTTPQLLRLFVMVKASSDTNRPKLIATARLAHERDLPTRTLSRETWHDCFVQLEYFVFVRSTATDDAASRPLDLCPAIANRPDLKSVADQDLGRTTEP